jgi:hypothetical protein
MPSKIVSDKQKSALALIQFGRTNAELVAAAIIKTQGPSLPAGTDIAKYKEHLMILMTSSSTLLEGKIKQAVDADEALIVEQADDLEPRRRRDEAGAQLREALVSLRGTLEGVYGYQIARELGFSSDTPQDPVVIARFAGEVLKVIGKRQAEETLPAPKEGISFNPQSALSRITLLRSALDGHLGTVEAERRELQQALSKKNEALAEYDEAFARVANLFVGLCLLAGEKELAQKVRPSGRNPGQLATEEESA